MSSSTSFNTAASRERRVLLARLREQALLWVAAERYIDAADRQFGTGNGYEALLDCATERLADLERLCTFPERCTDATGELRVKLAAYRRQARRASVVARLYRGLVWLVKALRLERSPMDSEPLHGGTEDAAAFGMLVSLIVSALYLGWLAGGR